MPDRRLSAIMFTDLVGYTVVTQKDEAHALRLLSDQNALIRSILPLYNGREVKTIGDAFLVEFQSALDAVKCAAEIQEKIRERNTGLPERDVYHVRIGIHLGDVVHEKGDIFGDGVNIASRIYPEADPDGICISESVAQQVRNKISFPLRPLPAKELKHVDIPLQLFEVVLPWSPRMRLLPLLSPRWVRRIRSVTLLAAGLMLAYWAYTTYVARDQHPLNRVAVLPFRDISPASEHAYFAEGMTEELISTLSHISGLQVIARTSTSQHTGDELDFGLIGESIAAGSIIEGTVRRYEDSVRITVRLIEANSERLLWNEKFDRHFNDSPAMQDDIASAVAGALRIKILDTERDLLTGRTTSHPDAWGSYLLARYHLNRRTSEDLLKAIRFFRESIDRDPTYADAHAGLAEAYVLMAAAGFEGIPHDDAVEGAVQAVDKALRLDANLAEAYVVKAYLLYRLMREWQQPDSLFRRAIGIKPSSAQAYEWYGLYLALKGDPDAARSAIGKAYSLDPASASTATSVGRIYALTGRSGDAIRHLQRIITEHPGYPEAYLELALAYGRSGQPAKAIPMVEKALELTGTRTITEGLYASFLARAGRTEEARHIVARLDSLADQRAVSAYGRALGHHALGNTARALDLWEQAFEEHDGLVAYLPVEPLVAELRDHPRFRDLMTRIGGSK